MLQSPNGCVVRRSASKKALGRTQRSTSLVRERIGALKRRCLFANLAERGE
jgi:hypothetical protein